MVGTTKKFKQNLLQHPHSNLCKVGPKKNHKQTCMEMPPVIISELCSPIYFMAMNNLEQSPHMPRDPLRLGGIWPGICHIHVPAFIHTYNHAYTHAYTHTH